MTLWTVAHQAPLSLGFSRQEYWSGLPCPPLGDLPNPGIEPISPGNRQVLYHESHLGSRANPIKGCYFSFEVDVFACGSTRTSVANCALFLFWELRRAAYLCHWQCPSWGLLPAGFRLPTLWCLQGGLCSKCGHPGRGK